MGSRVGNFSGVSISQGATVSVSQQQERRHHPWCFSTCQGHSQMYLSTWAPASELRKPKSCCRLQKEQSLWANSAAWRKLQAFQVGLGWTLPMYLPSRRVTPAAVFWRISILFGTLGVNRLHSHIPHEITTDLFLAFRFLPGCKWLKDGLKWRGIYLAELSSAHTQLVCNGQKGEVN